MKATSKIKVDLTWPNIGARVNAVQGDGNTRSVEITLLSDGRPWVPPAGVEAAIAYRQPGGTKGLYNRLADDTPAVSIDGNVATVILAPQMLTAAGTVQASIVFNNAALDQLTTFPFAVSVAANQFAGAPERQDYIRLQWLEDKLDEYLIRANNDSIFLHDLVITATGDSTVAAATGESTPGGYVKLIADLYGMDYENVACGGATIAYGIRDQDDVLRSSICESIASMRSDADIILLSGGVNDQAMISRGLEAMGELTEGFDSQLNKATLCGGLEYLLRQAIYKWSNKTILFVIPHRMTTRLDFIAPIHAACKKYGVSVVDLSEITPDMRGLKSFKAPYTASGDGWHANDEGYLTYYVPPIVAAIKTYYRGNGVTVSLDDPDMPDVISVNTAVDTAVTATPDIAGFIRIGGTISTSANYLRTDYLPLAGKSTIEYNAYVSSGTGMATWALFDSDKNWLASSDDVNGTDYYNTPDEGNALSYGYLHRSMSVSELLEAYPDAAYIVLSTYVASYLETSYMSSGGEIVNIGWSSGTAYITLSQGSD